MKISLTDNLGLKLIALILAIAVYYAIKPESSDSGNEHDRQRIFNQH